MKPAPGSPRPNYVEARWRPEVGGMCVYVSDAFGVLRPVLGQDGKPEIIEGATPDTPIADLKRTLARWGRVILGSPKGLAD